MSFSCLICAASLRCIGGVFCVLADQRFPQTPLCGWCIMYTCTTQCHMCASDSALSILHCTVRGGEAALEHMTVPTHSHFRCCCVRIASCVPTVIQVDSPYRCAHSHAHDGGCLYSCALEHTPLGRGRERVPRNLSLFRCLTVYAPWQRGGRDTTHGTVCAKCRDDDCSVRCECAMSNACVSCTRVVAKVEGVGFMACE